MTRILFASLLIFCFSFSNAQQIWKEIDETTLNQFVLNERTIIPDQYDVYKLNLDHLKSTLKNASLDDRKVSTIQNGIEIDLPVTGSQTEKFRVVESNTMHPELAAKYPMIKSFRAVGVDRPELHAKFNYGPNGLRAAISTVGSQIYIDNYSDNNDEYYVVYDIKDHYFELPAGVAFCGMNQSSQDLAELYLGDELETRSVGAEVFLRKYRFALACTGEWGTNKGTVANALSEMVTGTDRVNLTLEMEAGITFELIANNDEIVFIDPNSDPYFDAHLGREILQQNTAVINARIGAGNYDVGHVFNRNCTDGIAGVAQFGSVCASNKGAGVSCVGTSNVVNFMVNVTIHEIGHQFAASHTWSLCSESSADQLATDTAYEPCGGHTFMSYAGVCSGENNLANSTSAYYHVASLQQMYPFSQLAGGGCSENILTENHVPDAFVDYEDGFSIPSSTPFELTGRAIDEDGDDLLYCWEQHDNGGLLECGNPIGNAPAFRSYPPDPSPTRVFPRLTKILNNTSDKTEVLIDYSRNMEFYMTVRDLHPSGVSVASWDNVNFKVTIDAGPFFLTNLNDEGMVMEVGQPFELTWDVANTDAAPVNCENVDVLLSTDGGFTYPYTLLKNTANDGTESFTVPLAISDECRIKIKASNNIFFDINNKNFEIVEPTEPDYYFSISNTCYDICIPDVIEVDIMSNSFNDFANDISYSVEHDLPMGTLVSLDNMVTAPGDPNKITVDFTNANASGNFKMTITGQADNADPISYEVFLNVLGTNFDDMSLIYPESGQAGIPEVPTFRWSKAQNAQFYTFEVGRNPALGNEAEYRISGITDTFIILDDLLQKSSLYYWKVYVENACADSETDLQLFGTEALSCRSIVADDLPVNISSSGQPVVSSFTFIEGEGNVSDINILNVKGTHDDAGDLVMKLLSPSGTEVRLVKNKCTYTTNFNCAFDDEAQIEVECPLSSGKTFLPLDPLSVLDGEPIQGDWEFIIEDTNSGNGGQFSELTLEICSNATLDAPYIVNNNPQGIPLGMQSAVQDTSLLTEDANNTADELVYTIINLPQFGTLFADNEVAVIGTSFTQSDIGSGKLKYRHDNTDELQDAFFFTVNDGEGGFIDVTQFDLVMGDFETSTNNPTIDFSMNIFPNPAKDEIFINVKSTDSKPFSYQIFDLNGKVIQRKFLGTAAEFNEGVNLKAFDQGIYILQVNDGKQRLIQRFTVQK